MVFDPGAAWRTNSRLLLTVQANEDPIIPSEPKHTHWLTRELQEGGFEDETVMNDLETRLHEITKKVYEEYTEEVKSINIFY